MDAGNVIVVLEELPHESFERKGLDLLLRKTVRVPSGHRDSLAVHPL